MDHTTMADLLHHLGGVPPHRVRLRPLPGSATFQDVLDVDAHEDRLCELVDGTLVEKACGFAKSVLGAWIGSLIYECVRSGNLGLVTGNGGPIELPPGQVRIPDVAFFAWNRLPGHRVPREPIPAIVPALVVEVLMPANTEREMARKLREYQDAGVRLVWRVDMGRRCVIEASAGHETRVFCKDDVLDGHDVLPGFVTPVRRLFKVLDELESGGPS